MDWTSVHTPTVVVLSSSEVELISEKNGLAFHEMLSAFSNCQIKIHFRSISSHYPLNQLKVRFIRASELRPRPIAVGEELMRLAVIPRNQEHYESRNAMDAQSADWYLRYRTLLQESLLCGEESMSECPALMMVVISTSDVDPLDCFQQLDSTHYMPNNIQSGQYDPNISRFYLLVHDVSSQVSIDPQALLRSMKSRFRNIQCQLLLINSLAEPNQAAPDVWKDTIDPVFFPEQTPTNPNKASITRGCCLSAEDMLSLRDLVHQVVIKEVVPAMEKRIAALNVTVTQSRKGVKNVIKSWWRKPREAEDRSNNPSGVQYRFDQIENQILTLADATLVMKDYETALSMFRLVKDDFKSDKALIHQGSCQVMIAICLVIMDSDMRTNKREAESALREALLLFQTAQQQSGNRRKEVTLATRMATQTAFLLADVLSSSGRSREAAEVLVKASRDESYLSSAILLEQAAWLFKSYSFERKFAFHVILSGIKFHSAQLEQHAVRCFTAAKYLYDGTAWVHIQDYIQAHLAKHLTSEGNVEGALRCYLSVVSAGRQSSDRQARYINDFISTFIANPDKLPQGERGCEVMVPKVLDNKLRVYECQNAVLDFYDMNDLSKAEKDMWNTLCSYIESESLAHAKNEGKWTTLLDECALKSVEMDESTARQGEKINYFVIKSVKVLNNFTANKFNTRVIGEPIVISLSLTNPLDIPIQILDMQLVPSLKVKGSGAEDDPITAAKCLNGNAFDDEANKFLDTSVSLDACEDIIVIDTRDMTLEPRQTTDITLRVCPLRSGQLQVTGLKWLVNGKVWSLHRFDLPGQLLQDTLEHRALGCRAPNTLLTFDVVESMPWLAFELDDLPESILQGEVVQCAFKIQNIGRVAASGMLLKSNAPWIYIGKEPTISSDSERQGESPSGSALIGASGTLTKIDKVLEAGESMSLPVWVRGVGGGKQSLKMILQYSSQEGKAVRYLRQSVEVCVLPSIHMLTSVAPLSSSEYLLSVALTNFRTDNEDDSSDMVIHETCCLSKSWKCEPLLTDSAPINTLKSQGSAVQFFKLTYQAPSLESDRGSEVVSESVVMSVNPFSPKSTTSNSAHSIESSVAYMCLDDMAEKFVKHRETHRLIRLAQGNEGAPRSVSSVRRERAAGSANVTVKALPNHHPGSLKAFCDSYPSDLAVMVTWGAALEDGQSLVSTRASPSLGNHHVSGLSVCPRLDQTKTGNKQEGCPLSLELGVSSTIFHSFSSDDDSSDDDSDDTQPCVIPVKVKVSNQQFIGAKPLNFVLEVAQESVELASDSSVSWLGPLSYTVNSLEANETMEVELYASFPTPGVYELNQFGVRMLNNGSFFTFPLQCLVTVLDKA